MRIDEWIEFGTLAYIKFFDPTLAPTDPANYYMEREWRSHSGVAFEPNEVAAVYVAPDWLAAAKATFPALVDRIKEPQSRRSRKCSWVSRVVARAVRPARDSVTRD